MKTKLQVILAFFLLGFSAFSQDGYLSNLSLSRFLQTNTPKTMTVQVKNTSAYVYITTGSIKWRLDNGTINSTPVNIGGGGINSSSYVNITLTPNLNITTTGTHVLKVWIVVTGDTNHSNDTLTKTVIGITNGVNNKVLIEEYTATWCQYCPAGNTVINTLSSNNNYVVASFHNSDAYSFPMGESYMEAYYPASIFTPGGIINMGEFGDYTINSQHPTWSSQTSLRVGVSPVALSFIATVDTITRMIKIFVTTNFKYAYTGDFYLNAYVNENDIIGSQTNGGSNYHHQHVVRKMIGGLNGKSGIIPSLPTVNTDYTYEDSLIAPSSWNIKNLELIAYVFELEQGKTNTLNAAKLKLFPANGIPEMTAENNSVSVFPNPASETFSIITSEISPETQIRLFDGQGKLMENKLFQNQMEFDFNINNYPKGIYIINITTANGVVNKKLLIQ